MTGVDGVRGNNVERKADEVVKNECVFGRNESGLLNRKLNV